MKAISREHGGDSKRLIITDPELLDLALRRGEVMDGAPECDHLTMRFYSASRYPQGEDFLRLSIPKKDPVARRLQERTDSR